MGLLLLPALHAQPTSPPPLTTAYEQYRLFVAQQQPDSARYYLLLAQKYWDTAPRATRKRLEQEGFSPASFRSLKNELQEAICLQALENKDTDLLQRLLAEKWPISDSLLLRMTQQVNTGIALQLLRTDNFTLFHPGFTSIAAATRKTDPELYQRLLQHARVLFFDQFDPKQLPNLVYFADLFPELSPANDSLLAEATRKQQYLDVLERYLPKWDARQYPRTLEALLEAYLQYGDPADYRLFYQKYPEAPDVDSIPVWLDQLQRGNQDPTFWLQSHNRLSKQYFVYQMVVKQQQPDNSPASDPVLADRLNALQDLLQRYPANPNPLPLPGAANTSEREYAPLRTADGNLLYFCRKVNGQEDIYVSRWESGAWTPALPLTAINHPDRNDAPLSISSDGQLLLIFQEGIVKWTEKNKFGWQKPQALFPQEYQSRWQGITSISADKQAIVFSARRKENIGLPDKSLPDLFVSLRQPDGSWSAPLHAGPVLNTPFTERSPFLHPDMRTLYFSSDGHGGLGGLDVFKTTRIGTGWTNWTPPVNLGPGINTPEDDWGYKVTTEGLLAYFARGSGQTNEDLYEIELPELFRPDSVIVFQGFLSDAKGQPLSGKILIVDRESGELRTAVEADPDKGYFFTTLPRDSGYQLLVLGEAALPLQVPALPDSSGLHRFQLSSPDDTPEALFVIPGLQFASDRSDIRPEFRPLLDQLAEWVIRNPYQLDIAGHTDDVGSAEYNQRLSLQRASAVKAYLVSAGCPAQHIRVTGMGLSQPLVPGSTEAARAKNRRVEIRIRELPR